MLCKSRLHPAPPVSALSKQKAQKSRQRQSIINMQISVWGGMATGMQYAE